MTRLLHLTQGKIAIVDTADYERLNQWKWAYHHKGYAMRTEKIDGKQRTIFMHRQILQLAHGIMVDHINGNGLDNRRCNLRPSTSAENQYNRKPRKGRRSRYKGVSWVTERSKWMAQIVADGKRTFLGYFNDDLEAALAYDKAALELHGEFARINFPLPGKIP